MFRCGGMMMAAVVLLTVFCGCTSVWQPAHGHIDTPGWSIEVPQGWMRFATPAYEMLSKDGPFLQYVYLQEKPLTQGFSYTRQQLREDMLPHEMARVIIDSLQADPQLSDFHLVTNGPAQVGGRPGFKLVYTYRDPYGLDMKTIYYGVISSDRFFNLRYTAAQRHYFAADMQVFQQMFQSLRWSDPS